MESGFIEHNSGKIYFETLGNGEPLVLLHGFSLDHRMWKPQIDVLSSKFRIITYDMRGFGKSSLPADVYSHHDDLKALLDHLKVTDPTLVGLSLGGEVAIDFCLTYPHVVNKLVLADTSLSGYKSTVDWNVFPETGLNNARKNWLNHSVFKTTSKNPRASQMLRKIVNSYTGWHWFHNDPRIKAVPSALERISSINIETKILIGEHDLPYYQSIADLLVQNIENSKKYTIKKSGHMVNLENPEEFNKYLLS